MRDPVGASVGDTVGIDIPDAIASRAAVAVFVVPVIALFAGYLAGFLLGPVVGLDGDRTGTVLAALCAAGAIFGVRYAEKRLATDRRFSPVVGAIIARGSERV